MKANKLLQEFKLGNRILKNRIIQVPMSVNYADEQGFVTQPEIEHYGRRAQGGVSMIITENFVVHPSGRQFKKQTLISDEKYLPGLKKLSNEIKKHGTLAIVQIVHAGRYAGPWEEYELQRRLAPSEVPFVLLPNKVVTPQEITLEEIDMVINSFKEAAILAERAGFDGVHIHGAQGFLISQFLSPRMNLRNDKYGGSFENRTRIAKEIITGIKSVVNPDFLVGFHLMSDELMKDGWKVEEAIQLAKLLEKLGVDFIIPVASTFESMKEEENAGLLNRPQFQLETAKKIKREISIPVVYNGRLGEPDELEELVSDEDNVLVGLARPLFSEPDFVKKLQNKEFDKMCICKCETAQCLRTQLVGSTCESWPQSLQEKGYYGYSS